MGEWFRARNSYGATIPPTYLKEMFINMLPNDFQDKVNYRRASLTSLEHIIQCVQEEISRLSDRRLAGLQESQLRHLAAHKPEA